VPYIKNAGGKQYIMPGDLILPDVPAVINPKAFHNDHTAYGVEVDPDAGKNQAEIVKLQDMVDDLLKQNQDLTDQINGLIAD